MGGFFQQVVDIKRTMESAERNITELQEQQYKALTDVYGGGVFKQKAEDLTDDTNAMTASVWNQLKELAAALEQQRAEDPGAEAAADFKIRRNMGATLTKKLIETIYDFLCCQTKYKHKYEDTLKRQFKIASPDATVEEVDSMLATRWEKRNPKDRLRDMMLNLTWAEALLLQSVWRGDDEIESQGVQERDKAHEQSLEENTKNDTLLGCYEHLVQIYAATVAAVELELEPEPEPEVESRPI